MSGGAPREDEAKALVRRLIDSVFNARDSGALAELAQDAEGAWRSAVGVLVELAAFPDYVLAVDDLVREGDRVAARITVRGTHAGRLGAFPPSGRPVTAMMIAVFHVAGGKIVDGWHSWDRGSAAGQLDAIPEPVLELADIQGNIVPGFRKDHSALLFLRIGDVDAARAWLGKLASIVATADEVLAFNRLFSAARRRRRFEGALRATWVNVAFAAPGLARLVPDAALVADAPFHEGMHARAPLLGDPSPAGWVVGAPELLPDVLVIVGSDSEADLDAQLRQLEPGEGGGLEVLRVERGATLPGDLAGHEHYGFKDGISQPGLR